MGPQNLSIFQKLKRAFLSLCFLVGAASGGEILLGGPILSEFLAINELGQQDDDGDFSDWIEILNASEEEVNLAGWFLSDDPDQLTRWMFPPIILEPQEYLLVFASGKNRIGLDRPLHTNFSLRGAGEYLALIAPDGVTIVSEFAPMFPPQLKDVSYGFQGAEQRAGFFQIPTPGAENTTPIGLILQPPVFSETSQILTSRPSLNLTLPPNSPPGAIIRFTTDGSMPSASSSLWTSPLRLLNATQVKAATFDPAGLYQTSEVITHRFIKLKPDLAEFTSNLPLVVIDSFGTDVDALGKTDFFTEAFSTFIDVDHESGRATLMDAPDFVGGSGIRVRGSSSAWLFPKKQYRFETWHERGDDVDVSLFGLPAESDWVLNAPWSDKSMMRNHIAYLQGREMGDYSVRTRHFELFFNPDGGSVGIEHYQGIYLLVENVKVSKDRLDLTKTTLADTQEPEITGGYILRKDRVDASDRTVTTTIEGVQLLFHEPEAPNPAQINYLRNYLNQMESALHGPHSADPEVGFRAYLDEDSFIDQHLITEGLRNADGFRLSTYFHKDRGGLLKAGPAWDFNLALGNASFNRGQFPDGWHHEDVDPNRFLPPYYWYEKMFEDPAFERRYWDRYFQLREAQWALDRFLGKIDDLAALLSAEATEREFTRWPTLGVDTYANAPGFRNRLTYQSEVDYLKNFMASRFLWMDTQFDRPPEFSITNEAVSSGESLIFLSPSGDRIYYTLDGSDPLDQKTTRQADGAIILEDSTWIKARTRRANGRWGALGTKRYLVDETPVLFISEIHYRPASTNAAESSAGFSRNDFEFLEISNPGKSTIDLSGAKFREGISFSFGEISIGPRESLILVKNLAAFESRYEGFAGVIAGEFSGNLDNGGETLTLEDRDRRVLLSLTYDDAAPWPTAADGDGPSLVLRSPRAPAQEAESWRASFEVGGSPGRFEWNQFTGDPSGDDNGNGISNLVEYAVGTDPIQFDTREENVVLILLTRNPDAASAEVFLQLSDDLASSAWADHPSPPVAREMNPDGTETLTFAVPAQERIFARVLVRLR